MKNSVAVKTINTLTAKTDELMKENALLKDHIAQLQFQVRKNNLIFINIPEIKNENCYDR
jgi:hypothetical protein